MAKVIAVANQKGGCSKTSVVANLGIGLAMEGKKVAVIDADPQGSLTASLGYPSIDSLKEISRFFSVTIDDLICPDEMITVAENDKREFVSKYVSLICCVLDALLAILVFIPAFGNGTDSSGAVSLFGLTGINPWVKTLFIVIISIAILNGISGVIIVAFSKPVWNRHRLVTGVVLSILAVLVFIATRQPYAGIVCFAFLVIKGFLIAKTK